MSQLTSLADIRVASVLSGLDEDRKIAAQTNKTQRVKIEKGHAWLIRFLPFPMGTRGMPWARLSQHWINGKPCFCKQHTSPDFGGDPNYVCPICEVADSMYSQAENDDDRDDFFQCQYRTNFLMYCLVIAKEDDRGRREEMSELEILTPYEFNIPKTAFGTFTQKLERSKARKGGDPNIGLLSLENGCDIWVARDKKNTYSFDLSDSGYGPIFDMDDQYEGRIVRIWRQLKQPTVKFHDDQRLNSIADMLAERAFKEAADNLNPDNQRRSRRSRDDEDEQPSRGGSGRSFSRTARTSEVDEEPAPAPARPMARPAQAPARPAPAPAPARPAMAPARATSSRFQAAQAALEAEAPPIDDTDQIPGAEVPAQEQAAEEAPPAEEEVPAQEQEQEPAPAPAPMRRAAARPTPVQAESSESAVDEADAPQVRTARPAGATPRPAAPPAAVAATRRAVPAAASPRAPVPSAASTRSAAPRSAQVDDDPEELPEEQHDPAPPPSQQAPAAPVRSAALSGKIGSRINALKANQG